MYWSFTEYLSDSPGLTALLIIVLPGLVFMAGRQFVRWFERSIR